MSHLNHRPWRQHQTTAECGHIAHVQLTESWRDVIPVTVQDRYDISETRNAAAVMKATSPDAFDDMVAVLDGFWLTLDKLTTPGGNKSCLLYTSPSPRD